MAENLVRLIYSSTAKVGLQGASLQYLLASCRRNNLRNGITGTLFLDEGRFWQVMEGTAESVRATFARIILDDRHSQIGVISENAVTTRSFAEFTTSFAHGSLPNSEVGHQRAAAARKTIPVTPPETRKSVSRLLLKRLRRVWARFLN